MDENGCADRPEGDEFPIARDASIAARVAIGRFFEFPNELACFGIDRVGESVIGAKEGKVFVKGGREADCGFGEIMPDFFAGCGIETVDCVVG